LVTPFKIAVQDGSPHLPLNANTAFTALQLLHGLKAGYQLKDDELKRGWAELKTTTAFFGRWQRLGERPLVIADSAHNEGGLKAAMEKLGELVAANQAAQLHLVIGVVDDKDLPSVLPLFPKQANYYFVNADIPRALPAAKLAAAAATYGMVGKVYSTVAAGLEVASATAKADDVIYVGGSIFTTAEVLSGK
jgi:dihydrofolate synthase/folylpolyglutamate synthase